MPDHEIQFVCQTHGDHGVLEVVPRVEGVLLTWLVDTFEADAGMLPTGDAYGGLTVTDDLVIWDLFEQPHRNTRDHTGFGPFRFDRHHYDTALQTLATAIGADGA